MYENLSLQELENQIKIELEGKFKGLSLYLNRNERNVEVIALKEGS